MMIARWLRLPSGALMAACLFTSGPSRIAAEQQRAEAAQQLPTVEVRLPVYEYRKGELPRRLETFEMRRFNMPPSRDKARVITRPPSPFKLPEPWRPNRYFGPFRSGSDLGLIQLRLHGQTATWYYNGFFASINATEDPFVTDIFRIYYRPDFALGTLASATLPANASPAYGQAVTSITAAVASSGYAYDILLSLEEISYTSRYGGSVCYRFRLADVSTPNRSELEPEGFGYEFGRDGSGGAASWRFDVQSLIVNVYVVPQAQLINPRQNWPYNTLTIAMEFDAPAYVAYKDGFAVTAEEGAIPFQQVLDAVRRGTPPSLQTLFRPPISLFTHAWIHNQHQTLIDPTEKVTQLVIGDAWADVFTEQYKPVIVARWRATGLSDDTQTTWFNAGGDPEWRVRVRSFKNRNSVLTQIRETHVRLDESSGTSFAVFAAFSPSECDGLQRINVRLRLREKDPVGDDKFVIVDVPLATNCSAIQSIVAANTWPTLVPTGMLPVVADAVSYTLCSVADSTGMSPPGGVCLDDFGMQGTSQFTLKGKTDEYSTMYWLTQVAIEAR